MSSDCPLPVSAVMSNGRRLSLWVIAVRLQLDPLLPHRIPLIGGSALGLKLPGELQRQLGLTVQIDAEVEPQLGGWVHLLHALYSRELLMRARPNDLFSLLIQTEMAVQGRVDDFPTLSLSNEPAFSRGDASGWQTYYLACVSMHLDGLRPVPPKASRRFKRLAGTWISASLKAVLADQGDLKISVVPVPTLFTPGQLD